MASPNPFLELEGVSFFSVLGDPPGAFALRDISLTIAPGDFLAVTGRSGAGKTTLLRLLSGILRPSGGRVLVDGVALPPDELVPGAVLMFEDPADGFVAATVAEEVAVGPANRGLEPDEVERIVAGALTKVGVFHLAERDPHRLSEGEQHMVALAAALACWPRAILLDEASASLDAPRHARVLELLGEWNRRGVSVVMASQDVDDLRAASRLLVLDGGMITWNGQPEEFLADPAAARAFGVEPDPLVSVAAELRTAGLSVPPGSPTVGGLACRLGSGR